MKFLGATERLTDDLNQRPSSIAGWRVLMPKYILPENVASQDGTGAVIALESGRGKPLLLTLEITRTIEQESLEMSIWGSSDQRDWKPLETFPQKFYCGTYSLLLDLTRHSDVRYLRAEWKMSRWGWGEKAPLFGFYLTMETAKLQVVGA